ncbi:glycosyltransferase family 4 protein [Frondihabitans australicus]|uniref:Glycosyltransferase involved in cell wall biosynthesis n=1 Tax=Frondihabitans australicus TaxID=386892 RepID=A0A495IC66_9MICO|nr:glycosyltransferase family 1 protein [Frondihabitans australicus]RKR73240.1 glycosyltransferase involved in cell wall biosynthesis [Frondihabitans australicus]
MPLTALVDATSIPANAGGVGRYLLNLVPALAERDDLRLVVASQARDAEMWSDRAAGAEVRVVPSWARSVPGRLVWEQVGLARLAASTGADVILSPHYTMPVGSRLPVVVTLHDATFFSHPELHSRLKRLFFRSWTRFSVRRAKAIVTPSQATLDEVRRATRARVDDGVVAYHGIDTDRFSPQSDSARQRATSGFEGSGPYVAFVGTVEPRKNVVPLVEAFLAVTADERFGGWRLLLAGGAGWDDEAVALLTSRRHAPRVQWTGFLDDRDLPAFLSGAEVVAYPSDGEGFGLPVLEGMACGTAVLTTRRLALPEVGGEVAVYAEPTTTSLEEALRGLLLDARTRTEHAEAGPARAASFTWARSADEHMAAFRLAAGAPE